MEIIRKKVQVKKDGKINLELITDLPEGEVDVVLVLESLSTKPYPNISKFIGTLTSFQEDPVEYQNKLRDEWK